MEIKKTKTNPELLLFSVIFLLTVLAWIIVEIYHIEKNKKISVEYETGMSVEIHQLPNLDLLDKLRSKQ